MSIEAISTYLLFIVCIFILIGSIFITFKLRFVQLRLLPTLISTLSGSFKKQKNEEDSHTIPPQRALITAMSTTIGVGTIVAPFIAINLGGPGALIGFLLTAFFGSAATFVEVNLSIKHRKNYDDGSVSGGPMQYLSHILSKPAAKWYATCCLILMAVWSGAQANQLALILNAPYMGSFKIPTYLSGILFVVLTLYTLSGGIKRLGAISAKLVPLMFLVYLTTSFWIIGSNIDLLPSIFAQIFTSFFMPQELTTGVIIGGIIGALRWGVFKGIQTTEAGIGTQSIPHSMAKTNNPEAQATLSMLSTYTAGFVALISGLVALITKTWQDESLPLGITMVAASFEQYFSYFGIIIITISCLLFGFGTILGNSFNGGQCWAFLTTNKKPIPFYIIISVMIFMGAILETRLVWTLIDFVLAAMAIPHMYALIVHTIREKIPTPLTAKIDP